jgi:hypothetical protein
MNILLPALFLTASLPLLAEDGEKKPISLTPMLGAEFGKMIEIEGKIVDDTDTRLRSHLGKSLIEVSRVNGLELKESQIMELFVFSFTDITIPVRGTKVRFRGYETGGFTGIPQEAFDDIPLVASTNHHFESQFQITKRLDPTPAEQAGTGQPATRPESKSEGSDKPQPEAEGRSR